MKKKRYWLRFGLIFGVTALVVSIPGIFMAFGFSPNILGGPVITSISSLIILPVQLPVSLIGKILGGNFVRENIYLAVTMLALIPGLFYFIVGVVIGGIHEKIKNRNFSTDSNNTIVSHNNKKTALFCLILIIIGFVYLALVSNKIHQLQQRPPSFYQIQ